MSKRTTFELGGLICALFLMAYLVGDIAGFWESSLVYSMALVFVGLISFGLAKRSSSRETANG
ncbi:hypothetical protein [Alteriqipengyuania lutimaris]|uniref:hypothetical protein n=1 Tax=Alteriqipengyuania lutimaris TaxID=1538146 RepID=UPI000E1D0ED4|nr:hypothetical protein [Alteriqipengyuania lutimaris]MBB3032785.1 hypothetical protein [Alteriqipengyuania lutimaris]